ncbi:MAG: metal-dependent hydrolase [Opitutaceae bacterium]|jgi:L-ascorbate metabolism protein UlaG (beta-lactamase superfamily)|nr:metal-dependent hydrolase [Opitutaceae bacterium]
MRITWYGHSCFLVETTAARIIIDPFLTGNPFAPVRAKDVKCDAVLVTHGHEDHTCDAFEIARANDATLVANYEIAEYFAAKGLATTHGMNPGGAHHFPFGRVKLTLAHHTSSLNAGLNPIYMGVPCGILLEADGKRLYHAGDTALFLDMQLIGRGGLDAALLPIGDNFTMGPEDAIDALDFLKPRIAVPMHYNTWPPIVQDPQAFAAAAKARGHEVHPLAAGHSLDI